MTRIDSHYTFEQSKFKKYFVIMNQESRQKSKTNVEKEFNKPLSNANSGYDCRNNVENCFCATIFDEIEEIP